MATYHLFRGDAYYRTDTDTHPGRQPPSIRVRHTEKFKPDAAFDPSALVCDCVETFVYDPISGRYISRDYPSLPDWVKRQEMEAQEEEDRRLRFVRFQAMMGSGR